MSRLSWCCVAFPCLVCLNYLIMYDCLLLIYVYVREASPALRLALPGAMHIYGML